MTLSPEDRFRGCLLGLAVGDALGARFEGQSAEFIRGRFPDVDRLIDGVSDQLYYTDDTQMAIGVAETLAEHGEIVEERLCRAFVANYAPSRGYGRGARAVIEAMEDGRDHRAVAATHFPGGSFGNGAAMRVAPAGLLFKDNVELLLEQAKRSALPTHVHPLGVEGARLLALAVAFASNCERFDRREFFTALLARCESTEYAEKLDLAARVAHSAELAPLGNGIAALESVPTAIASFALTPYSYAGTIGNVILLGGDTDTMAAMAGAISGAFLGTAAIGCALIDRLEDAIQGRTYLVELADRLHATHTAQLGRRAV
jgi:poly(ADP-ribose) glycohydrolase ARH3